MNADACLVDEEPTWLGKNDTRESWPFQRLPLRTAAATAKHRRLRANLASTDKKREQALPNASSLLAPLVDSFLLYPSQTSSCLVTCLHSWRICFPDKKKKNLKKKNHKFYSTYSPDVQKTATQYKFWQQETMLLQVCINQNQNIDVFLFLFNKVPQGFRVLHRCKHYHVYINNMTTHNLSWLLSHRWDFENKDSLRIFQ